MAAFKKNNVFDLHFNVHRVLNVIKILVIIHTAVHAARLDTMK